MRTIQSWSRWASLAFPLLGTVACGVESSSAGDAGSGGSSAGTSGASASGGGAATGAVGTAWFEIIEPFPADLEPGTDPATITHETTPIAASEDGSALVGASWFLSMRGSTQFGANGFHWTRATGAVDLGYPGPAPETPIYISPERVSRDASVVVGRAITSFGTPVFHWSQSAGMVDIGNFEGSAPQIELDDLSADGSVIAGTLNQLAFRWTAETGIESLGVLPGRKTSDMVAVSGDGRVIFGASSDDSVRTLFRWTAANGMEALADGCQVAPGGVNDDGSKVVGMCSVDGGVAGYQWSEARGVQSLGLPPSGYDILRYFPKPEQGVLVAQGRGPNREDYQALRATEQSGFVALGALPDNPSCFALGRELSGLELDRTPMNADGSVVAGTCMNTAGGTQLGFRWSERSGLVAMRPLAGHVRTLVTSVSSDGIVAGTSSDGASETEGVLWDANGEPRSIRVLLEGAGVALDGFSLDEVVVIRGGRLLYGAGRNAAGAGRTWVALLP